MDSEIKTHISSTETWGRALFMILFGIIYSVAEIVLITVVIIQFCFVLIAGEKNVRLLQFGRELSEFIYQVFLYQTFNSEEKPFPFASWPTVDSDLLEDESGEIDDIDSQDDGSSTQDSNR